MDLSTKYLGLSLDSPLIAAASPLTGEIDSLRQLEDAGASAVVLPSLFEEQIVRERPESRRAPAGGMDISGEAGGYFPELENTVSEAYLRLIENAKKALGIPVIASINGSSQGMWVEFAQMMQKAGADAVELNVYLMPTDPDVSSADVEDRYVDLLTAVRDQIEVPIGVKIGPFFSSMAYMACRLEDAGADALVLFNRFLYPDIDLGDLRVVPNLQLSTDHELGLPLRWIAILREYLQADLAASSGAHSAADAAKLLLAGADIVMFASCLLQHGPSHFRSLRSGLKEWMEENEYDSVEQMRGSMSQANCLDPEEFERANYRKALAAYRSDPT